MSAWVATESVFGWHGVGSTWYEAAKDLIENIVDDYKSLTEWPGSLAKHLSTRLERYKEYMVDASQD